MIGPVVGYLVRIELRRNWRSLLALAVVAAVVVSVVLASLAGTRRASSSFDRYLDTYRGPEAMAAGDPEALAALGDLEAVEAAVDMELVSAFPVAAPDEFYPLISTEDGAVHREMMRAPLVEGRVPDPDAPLEVALSERTSRRLDLEVGDVLPLTTFSPEATAVSDETGDFPEPDGPPLDLAVVGIVRDPGDVGARESDITLTFLTPAFRETYPYEQIGSIGGGTFVAVADGYSLEDVAAAMEGQDVEIDGTFSADSTEQQVNPTVQAIATALRIFAAIAALAGLIALAQAVARLHQGAAQDDATLAALGARGWQRWARLTLPTALFVGAGAAVGVLLATAASPLFPVGLARRADPDPGFDIDVAVLVGGGALAALALAGVVGALAWWRVRRPLPGPSIGRVGRMGKAAADLGMPTPAVTGLSLAAGTPGRPGRLAVGGTIVSVLGVLAALVFSANIERLLHDPELYGWGWDAVIEGADMTDLGEDPEVGPRLAADPDILAMSDLYTQVPATIDGTPDYATAVTDPEPALEPIVVKGAAPRGAAELALGGGTLAAVGADVGDTVALSFGDGEHPMRISGVVAFPVSSDGGSSASGVYLSPAAVAELDMDRYCSESDSCTRTIAVELRPGSDAQAFAERYRDREADLFVALPRPPGDVDRLTAVDDLPRYLAIFLAALAVAAISFATTTTVRQRRQDLAMLRVLGMTSRHIGWAVIVLVLALTAAGAVIGGVLGVILGRQVWQAVMASVSLPFSPSLPIVAAILVPIAALLLAQLVATSSRRTAVRTPAALVLRTE